jgi:hypothetical protein
MSPHEDSLVQAEGRVREAEEQVACLADMILDMEEFGYRDMAKGAKETLARMTTSLALSRAHLDRKRACLRGSRGPTFLN